MPGAERGEGMTAFGTIAARCLAAAMAAALAGCAAAPRLPLMTPLETGAGFGYSERQLAERRYAVSYLAPVVRTSIDRARREADAEEARGLAYDLALWRAARLALRDGFAAFALVDSRTDVEVEVIDEGRAFPYTGLHRHDGRHGAADRHRYDRPIPFRLAWLQARVTLTVELLDTLSVDAFDARATARRLKEKRPGALRPPDT